MFCAWHRYSNPQLGSIKTKGNLLLEGNRVSRVRLIRERKGEGLGADLTMNGFDFLLVRVEVEDAVPWILCEEVRG